MIEAKFELEGDRILIDAMRNVVSAVSGPGNRLIIGRAGVPIIQSTARSIVKIFKGPTGEHYLYDTPKLIKKLKAPNGKGRIKTIYQAGNTAVAIQDLSEARISIARHGTVIVGPLIRRSIAKGPLGTSERNADAAYAHFIYGSARAFGQNVMQKTLQQSGWQALDAMERQAIRMLEAEAKKQGLT